MRISNTVGTVGSCLAIVLGTPGFAVSQGPPELWQLSLNVDGNWDSNLDLDVERNAGIASRYGLGLTYTRNTSRTQFSMAGSGSANQYFNQAGGDRFGYAGTLSWDRILSPTTRFHLSDSLVSAYVQATPLLTSSGLVFPYSQTLTNQLQLSLEHDLAQQHAISLIGSHDHVVFNDSELIDGDQASLGASYRRRFDARTTGGLTYSFSLNQLQERDTTAHSLSLYWSRQLGRTTELGLSVGGTAFRVQESEPISVRPIGSASLRHQTERNSYSLSYSRRVDQAFGFGRQRVGDVVSLSWNRALGRLWSISLSGGYGRSRDPSDPTFVYESQYLAGGFGVQLMRNFSLGANGSATRRSLIDDRYETSFGAGLRLSYSWEWR